jgi:hypothetical protein
MAARVRDCKLFCFFICIYIFASNSCASSSTTNRYGAVLLALSMLAKYVAVCARVCACFWFSVNLYFIVNMKKIDIFVCAYA